jgi:hypothetical protein
MNQSQIQQSPVKTVFGMPPKMLEATPLTAPPPPSQGPRCYQCGGATIRNGTCFLCIVCGMTTGCS